MRKDLLHLSEFIVKVIDECKVQWKISNEQMLDLINSYNIITYLQEGAEWMKTYEHKALVEELEQYIHRQGGVLDG